MSTINLLFWNGDQARLRAGWRLLVYSALWFTLGYVAIYLRNTVLAGRLPEVYRTPLLAAIFTLLVVVFLTGMVGSRLLDRRPFADYGFHLSKGWWLDLASGWRWARCLCSAFSAPNWRWAGPKSRPRLQQPIHSSALPP